MNWGRAREYPDLEAWLGARRIGSSSVAAILGRSRYSTAYREWRRLIGRPLPDRSGLEVEQGLRWEPVIRTAYAVETGRRIAPFRGRTMFVGPAPWSTSTPDGVLEDEGEQAPGELKLSFERGVVWPPSQVVERWSVGLLPRRDWYLQVQHQCYATDAPFGELVVLLPSGHELRVYRIRRDQSLIDRIVAHIDGWWDRHVVQGQPLSPETVEDRLEAASETFAPAKGQRYRRRPAQPAERQLIAQLEWFDAARKMASQQRAALQVALFERAGRASALTFNDGDEQVVASIIRNPPHVRVHRRKRARRRRDVQSERRFGDE